MFFFHQQQSGQRCHVPKKPPPWLRCGSWNQLVGQPSTLAAQEETTRVFSETDYGRQVNHHQPTHSKSVASLVTASNNCSYPDDKTAISSSSVVAYSNTTKENTSDWIDPNVQDLVSKYLAIDDDENKSPAKKLFTSRRGRQAAAPPTDGYSATTSSNKNNDGIDVSPKTRSDDKPHNYYYCYPHYSMSRTAGLRCSSSCSSDTNDVHRDSIDAVSNQVNNEDCFQEKQHNGGIDKDANWKRKLNKAPPFRKLQPKHSKGVDPKLREQLLVEIQYGKDRLRSPPMTPKQPFTSSPRLTLREQLLQEIRQKTPYIPSHSQ